MYLAIKTASVPIVLGVVVQQIDIIDARGNGSRHGDHRTLLIGIPFIVETDNIVSIPTYLGKVRKNGAVVLLPGP